MVDNEGNCLETFKLPVKSAQVAEIDFFFFFFTNSHCGFSATHENRGFLTTAGKPTQHVDLSKELLVALMMPSQTG